MRSHYEISSPDAHNLPSFHAILNSQAPHRSLSNRRQRNGRNCDLRPCQWQARRERKSMKKADSLCNVSNLSPKSNGSTRQRLSTLLVDEAFGISLQIASILLSQLPATYAIFISGAIRFARACNAPKRSPFSSQKDILVERICNRQCNHRRALEHRARS